MDRIRSQQIRESFDFQLINGLLEWDEHVTRMYAEKLVKILRDQDTCRKKIHGKKKRNIL